MIRRVMLDIETLGTEPGAFVREIAAVEFTGGVIRRTFAVVVQWQDLRRYDFRIDAGTVQWWLEKERGLRGEFFAGSDGVPLLLALGGLAGWLRDVLPALEPAEVWACGPDFDCALLEECYRRAKLELPWIHWNQRCYRTLKKLRPDIGAQRQGSHHCALDDAQTQAEHACRLLEVLGVADWVAGKEPEARDHVLAQMEEALETAGDLRDEGTRVVVPDDIFPDDREGRAI